MERQPMHCEIDSTDGTTVVSVDGDLDADSAPGLQTLLTNEFERGHAVVLDLSRCPFLDSVGIGVLVYGWKTADAAGARFRLRNVGRYPRRVLDLVGLTDLIPVA